MTVPFFSTTSPLDFRSSLSRNSTRSPGMLSMGLNLPFTISADTFVAVVAVVFAVVFAAALGAFFRVFLAAVRAETFPLAGLDQPVETIPHKVPKMINFRPTDLAVMLPSLTFPPASGYFKAIGFPNAKVSISRNLGSVNFPVRAVFLTVSVSVFLKRSGQGLSTNLMALKGCSKGGGIEEKFP